MNVIIAGCGRVGSELAQSVSAQDHRVVIIDPEPYVEMFETRTSCYVQALKIRTVLRL